MSEQKLPSPPVTLCPPGPVDENLNFQVYAFWDEKLGERPQVHKPLPVKQAGVGDKSMYKELEAELKDAYLALDDNDPH